MGRSIPTRSGQVLRPYNEKMETGVALNTIDSCCHCERCGCAEIPDIRSGGVGTGTRPGGDYRGGPGERRLRAAAEVSRADRGMGRASGGVRFVFWFLFHLGRASRTVPGRSVCAADLSREGNRQGAARKRGRGCVARELLRRTMGSAGLESTCDRLLQEAGRYIPRSVEIGTADGRSTGARSRSELKLPHSNRV